MLLLQGSYLTASGRLTLYSLSWRACDYADKSNYENQGSVANCGTLNSGAA